MNRTIQFKFERETKNTVRYQEIVPLDKKPVVRILYIQKSALGAERPSRIEVSIKSISGESITPNLV